MCGSRINHGSNSSINEIYSGTMSAAVEAGTLGIPAIGFSLMDFSLEADFNPGKKHIKKIALEVLNKGLPEGVVLNVNIPKLGVNEIRCVKICRQANAHWLGVFDKRTNPLGRDYYWMAGELVNLDNNPDTDEWALKEGYISVVPLQYDFSSNNSIPV